jgi:predicted AlkP superfamily phosphohydrolase/phosphomutase
LRKKVIVIGLDGLEPSVVETMLERGELPNLARIRAAGGYGRLQTT